VSLGEGFSTYNVQKTKENRTAKGGGNTEFCPRGGGWENACLKWSPFWPRLLKKEKVGKTKNNGANRDNRESKGANEGGVIVQKNKSHENYWIRGTALATP